MHASIVHHHHMFNHVSTPDRKPENSGENPKTPGAPVKGNTGPRWVDPTWKRCARVLFPEPF